MNARFRWSKAAGPLLFLCIWILILSAHSRRVSVKYLLAGNENSYPARLWPAPFKYLVPNAFNGNELKAFAARHPDDVYIQARATEWTDLYKLGYPKWLEPLLTRFPDDAWLRAFYLDLLCRQIRISSKEPPKPEILRHGLEVAAQGAAVEPDNAYFDVVRAFLLFAGRRDKEALKAIRSASLKSRFDDHTLETYRAQIAFQSLSHAYPAEERVLHFGYTNVSSFGHELVRTTLRHATQRQRDGDQNGALELRAAVANIAGKIRDSACLSGDRFQSYCYLQGTAWRGAVGLLRIRSADDRNRLLIPFEQQCRALGRNDLIQEARRDLQTSQSLWPLLPTSPNILPGVPLQSWIPILSMNWLGAVLLYQIILLLAAWLSLSFFLSWKRVPGQAPRARTLAGVLGIAILLCATLETFALQSGAGWASWSGFLLIGVGGLPPPPPWSMDSLFGLTVLIPVLFTPLLLAAILRWKNRVEWRAINRRHFDTYWPPIGRRVTWFSLVSLTLGATLGTLLAPSLGIKAPSWQLDNFLIAPGSFLMSAVFSAQMTGMALMLCFLWWIVSAIWLVPPPARPLSGAALRAGHQGIGALLLLSSLLFLLLLMRLDAARRPAEAVMTDVLRRGYLEVLRHPQP